MSDDTKKDLTRLEDLSEFLHELDEKTDKLLGVKSKQADTDEPLESEVESKTDEDNVVNLESLDANEEAPQEIPEDPEDLVKKNTRESAGTKEGITSEISLEEGGFDASNESTEPPHQNDLESENIEIETQSLESSDSSMPEEDITIEEPNQNDVDIESTEDFHAEATSTENLVEEINVADVPENDVHAESESDQLYEEQNTEEIPEISAIENEATQYVGPQETSHESPAKENFQDVRDFAESISYGQVAQGGNPPYSIVMKNIKYKEDADNIRQILNDHGLLGPNSEKEIEQGLVNGSLLISQLSEYSAVYLSHAFRRFDMTLEMGLSAELHQSKSYKDESYRGMVSKRSLYQNVDTEIDLTDKPISLDQIILSTLPQLENYQIHRYIDVVTESTLVDEIAMLDKTPKNKKSSSDKKIMNNDSLSIDFTSANLGQVYKDLAQNLRIKAKELKGNGVVGINYQITPIVCSMDSWEARDLRTKQTTPPLNQYRITCTGSVVWLSHS